MLVYDQTSGFASLFPALAKIVFSTKKASFVTLYLLSTEITTRY